MQSLSQDGAQTEDGQLQAARRAQQAVTDGARALRGKLSLSCHTSCHSCHVSGPRQADQHHRDCLHRQPRPGLSGRHVQIQNTGENSGPRDDISGIHQNQLTT